MANIPVPIAVFRKSFIRLSKFNCLIFTIRICHVNVTDVMAGKLNGWCERVTFWDTQRNKYVRTWKTFSFYFSQMLELYGF